MCGTCHVRTGFFLNLTNSDCWVPPQNHTMQKLEDLLDPTTGTDDDIPRSTVPITNLWEGLHHAAKRFKVNPLTHLIVMDLFGTRVNMQRGRSPTITATRASSGGYWLSSQRRFTNTDELMKLQGIPPQRYAWRGVVTARQLGHMIGNGVSVNVADALMREILDATTIGL